MLTQCQTDRAQVSTVNGDITYSGRLSKAGRYELKTHSGDIMLHHQGSAFEVAASTFSGDIKFDQPLPATVKANTNRYGPGRSVRGAMGGGGAYLELTTFSGDIIVGKMTAGGARHRDPRVHVPATRALHAPRNASIAASRDPRASPEPPERRLASEPNCLR